MSSTTGRAAAAPLPRHLANEAATVQFPLVRHASDVGWSVVSKEDSLRKRGGEQGLFFYDELRDALLRLNEGVVTADNVQSIISRMEGVRPNIEGNREILEWLRGQRTVLDETEKRHRNVTVIDYEHPDRNRFHVTYEWTSRAPGRKGNRADIIFLINGVPVAIVENKNPDKRDALTRGVTQLRRYEVETPELMVMPQVFNVTHLIEYYYGVTWNYARKAVFKWKVEPSETYREAVHSFFRIPHFLELLREWLLFYVKDDELQKTVLRQHQTRAVAKVIQRCADPRKRRGLVWHTQGAGKTFTMLTSARLILQDTQRFPGATALLVVDRNELEGQLSGWVDRVLGELQGASIAVARAGSRAELQDLLDRDFRGLIVSMIHKFEGLKKDSCSRSDVFIMIDEAHRSTGGDLGNYLTGALPNATLIGFTGTPIDKTAYGQGTFKTFGAQDAEGYLDKYTIKESIEDGTTVKLRHAMAPGALVVPVDLLEREFLALKEAEGISDVEELNRILERAVTLRAFLKADARVANVARFIAQHFRENVLPLGYKAFLVAVDREACALYKRELDKHLPPEWTVPVYTPSAADVVDRPLVAQVQLAEAAEKEARKLFLRPDKDPRIFIVTDKLLTGFDAPILYSMYLDKPMRDHVLLQAIARVNRPYEDDAGHAKPCGLIVDFVGVLKELNKALAFQDKDVSGVIEDLDVLLARFRHLMNGEAKEYLARMTGAEGNDVVLDRLLYETFLEPEARRRFAELFQEIEGLYEVLSPSAELRDYITPYNRLADLYVMLRNAYGAKEFYYGDVAKKTEKLVRENASLAQNYRITRTAEFTPEALDALRRKPGNDEGKVVNLVRAMEEAAQHDGETQPHLLSISERAAAVLDALEERQTTTDAALNELDALVAERVEAEQLRRHTGLDAETFSVYWVLRRDYPAAALELARDIAAIRARFPHASSNADEFRQLKAETYKVLMRVVNGRPMIELAERVLGLARDQ